MHGATTSTASSGASTALGAEGGTNRVVVGFDGSDGSIDALALAGVLAEGTGPAEVTVASVLKAPLGIRFLSDDAQARHFTRVFAEAEAVARGFAFRRREISAASPARGLDLIATQEQADLIVLGSSNRARLGRVLAGSVAERLLQGGPCAVAVATRGFAAADRYPLRRIGVGYDGGVEAHFALDWATEFARSLAAELRIIAVAPPAPSSLALSGHDAVLRERRNRMLDEAMLIVGDRAVARAVSARGEPAAALVEQAELLDLLVIGSRGYGPLRRTILGGVARQLIHRSPCPLLVLPRSAVSDADYEPVPGT